MIPVWLAARPWVWKLAVVAAIVIGAALWVRSYGAKQYEAGRQEIIQQDLKLLQERLVENAKQAERDRAAIEAAKVQYEELQSQSSGVAADLGRRLGLCVAATRRPSSVPGTAPGTGVAAGAAREPSPDEAAARLTEAAIAACARDADRLKTLQDLVRPRRN